MKRKTARIGLRVDPQEKEQWEEAAKIENLSLSKWMTKWVNFGAHYDIWKKGDD